MRKKDREVSKEPQKSIAVSSLQEIIDNSAIGIYETRVDGSIMYANQPLLDMIGVTDLADALDTSPTVDGWYVAPNASNRFRDIIIRDGEVRGFIAEIRRKDGSTFWASEHSNPVRNDGGKIIGFIGSLTDVTALIETQDALQAAEGSYRRIFDRVTEGVYRSSIDGRQLRANPALVALNGYSSEQEQLDAVKDIGGEWYVDPKRRDEFGEIMKRDGQVIDFVSEIYRHKTREKIWITENAYLVRDAEGNPLYYEGTVREITAQIVADQKLRKALVDAKSASEAKTQFLAQMSHELRTPLNAILGFSDLIRTGVVGQLAAEKVTEYADDIYESGHHLLDLINDILDLSRIESGAFQLEIEAFSANAILDHALTTLRPLADGKKVQLTRNPSDDVLIEVDRRAMYQCLLNIMSNAVKFSNEGGVIQLDISSSAGMATFAISDTGPGIPDHILKRIGEAFVNVRAVGEFESKGAGLGLAITKSLVAQMSGQLTFETELGVGTTVKIVIPTRRSVEVVSEPG